MNNGLFQPIGMSQDAPADMSTLSSQGQTPAPVQMPSAEMSQGVPAQNTAPVYVGDPIIDKYIHMFIGG